MHAVVLEKISGPFDYRTVDDPKPRPDEVVVKVAGAGVCGRDLIDRRGGFPAMKLPAILGHEFAGEVVEVGSEVSDFKVGDRVANLHRPFCGYCPSCTAGEQVECDKAWQSFGHTVDGGYAELVAAHHRALLPVPDEIPLERAAPVACTAAVALRALRHEAKLQFGETVLITGASGGVGMPAVQIAKRMGARVVVTTTSEKKADALQKIGADEVIISPDGSFHKEVRARTDGGVHVSLDLTGSATFRSALRSLRRRGRLVLVGNIQTENVSFNPGALILNSALIVGSHGCSRRDLSDCFDLMRRGELDMVLDRTLPLAEAEQAHRLLADRAVTGRVVLTP